MRAALTAAPGHPAWEDALVSRADDLATNRALWDELNTQFADEYGRSRWASPDVVWGLYAIPEASLAALGPVAGRDVVELGCGGAHLSAWLTRRGARVVAMDLSGAQLDSARRAQAEHGVHFPLIQADAEQVPLPDAVADLVVSEHGAAAYCEPSRWVGEAARLLRPGGRLVFLTNSPLSAMCVPAEGGPAGDRLLRGPDDLVEVRWPGGGVEHHPGHGDWVRVLTESGFEVQALHELRAGPSAVSEAADFYGIVDAAWARRWPVEDLWVARRA